ncbi:uncharacterized protein LOC122657075 isoform X2 [Telopea speciosissima]|uniref:uncharacterized protein LOC122657075 isoform X2 n=1 Tax=Telopea speciosissima TaxID=54955 RepID=UPI001CC6A022|nr:uncharacterized protein LOC122657075 isoform X2 [Telopea speciosissima]
MAATAASEVSEGPVLSLMSKRLRNLKKKYNRILQMEESIAQGKALNKEQEEVLRSKPAVTVLIEEYEKLRQPLSTALQEELNLALQHLQVSAAPPVFDDTSKDIKDSKDESEEPHKSSEDRDDADVEDLLKLLYFGCLFDVKPQSDFTSTMLTRTHERGCCLTYDYVTDDATDLLGERDLDLISMLGSLVISRPLHSSLSHKNALRSCVEHAKHWLANSDQPIESGATVTYDGLRERLNKILASDYFTTTPEMKAAVEVVAAAGKYAPCQVQLHDSSVSLVPVQVENAYAHYEQKDEELANFRGQEPDADQSSPVEELSEDVAEVPNTAEVTSAQQEQKAQAEWDDQSERNMESKEQQYIPRRAYQNQRGGRGGGGGGGGSGSGRRGYANGRGGRSGRGGGGYQNGRNQFYEQPGNYNSKNYNSRGRGSGGHNYNNYGSATHGSYTQADVELGS